MPFGLTNALATCQELLNWILGDTLDENLIICFDDIFIYSKTETKHIKHIQHILQQLQKHDLKIEPKNYFFHKNKMDFLRYQTGIHEITMKPNKIKKILNWLVPKTIKELQKFLKFTNFNQQFIKNYFKHTEPFTSITKKNTSFKWDSRQQKTFKDFQDTCGTEFILQIYNLHKVIQLKTDINDLIIKVYLTQKWNNKRHSITYYFQNFQK